MSTKAKTSLKPRILIGIICISGLVGCDAFKNESEPDEPPAYEFIRVDLISSLTGLRGYGSSLALGEDWAFVSSSSCRGHPEAFEGIAIFERNGDSWTEHQVLQNPLGLMGFGCYIAESGNYLAATAGSEIDGINGVVVFELVDDDWKYLQTIRPINDGLFAEFGYAISMSDDRLVVGSPGENSKVYSYRHTGTSYEIEQIIENPDASIFSFGREIDLDGGILAVSAGVFSSFQTTAFYIYTFDGSKWSLSHQEHKTSEQHPYAFAQSVAVDQGSVFVGSRSTSDGSKEGGVELYSVAGYQFTVATAFDSSGVDHGFALHIAARNHRLLATEGRLRRVRLFEEYNGIYTEVGVIENTLSEGAIQHSSIDLNKDWIGISSVSDRSAFTYLMIRK